MNLENNIGNAHKQDLMNYAIYVAAKITLEETPLDFFQWLRLQMDDPIILGSPELMENAIPVNAGLYCDHEQPGKWYLIIENPAAQGDNIYYWSVPIYAKFNLTEIGLKQLTVNK